ncbi:MAG TPA: sulfite exporter TauE/SafE family protein [Vicinamibacterales bacterium]|nr:sulfite exporter TauE/SafE family protein [Vicinamibacterales bacterium]
MGSAPHELLAFGAAFLAGAINSVAGGGTLVSFPALIWLGLPSTTANATSTVAIWPGSLGGMLGFRDNLRGMDRRMYALIVPSLIGGISGAILLRMTPTSVFDRLVPLLILFATCLFMAQDAVQRMLKIGTRDGAPRSANWYAGALAFQLVVGLYGGYFGAGLGIMMLAALSIIGLTDIHQMNGLKNLLALCINGVAALYFVWKGMVYWPDVIVMAIGAIAGGVGGAGVAKRLGRVAVRRVVVAVGLVMAVKLMLR